MGRLLGNSAQHTWCAKYLHIMYKCCFVFEICSVQKSTCTVPSSPNVNMGSSKENPSQAHLTSSLSRKRAFCLTFKVLRMLPTGSQTGDKISQKLNCLLLLSMRLPPLTHTTLLTTLFWCYPANIWASHVFRCGLMGNDLSGDRIKPEYLRSSWWADLGRAGGTWYVGWAGLGRMGGRSWSLAWKREELCLGFTPLSCPFPVLPYPTRKVT